MKKLVGIIVLLLVCQVGQSQDLPEKDLSIFEKMLFKTLFKPFLFDLPSDVFDERDDMMNVQTFDSSKYPESRVVATCFMFIEGSEFQLNEERCIEESFEYGEFMHFSGQKVRYMTALSKKDKNIKVCHFIVDYDGNTYNIVLETKTENFALLFDEVSIEVKKIRRK